jgi:nucleoside 2-deoxyribosyltransferase
LEVAQKLGFVVERADNIEHNDSILKVIQDRIRYCDAVIADATGRNANVFYEIGYAAALGKPTIIIIRKGETIPFDVQSVNLIIYESIVELRERLEKRIKGTFEKSGVSPTSP